MERHERLAAQLNAGAPPEIFAEACDELAALKARYEEARDFLKAAMFAYVEERGPQTVNETRWHVAVERVTKCIDPGRTFRALLEVTDLDTAIGCLSSDAIKQGAAKRVDNFDWDRHFAVEVRRDLKGDKPRRTLQATNTNFATAGKGTDQ